MTDREHKRDMSSQGLSNDSLGREFDAALAKYAAVEPRIGLEERILANLRAKRERSATNSWWRWSAVAALSALFLVTGVFAWKSRRPAQNIAAHVLTTSQTNAHDGTPNAPQGGVAAFPSRKTGAGRQLKTPSRRTPARRTPAPVLASAPKLEQFPSPQPLSEQETILARYVTKFPEHAALIAQARTEELQRDSVEETGLPANENSPSWNK
jgi:hypothetical protein